MMKAEIRCGAVRASLILSGLVVVVSLALLASAAWADKTVIGTSFYGGKKETKLDDAGRPLKEKEFDEKGNLRKETEYKEYHPNGKPACKEETTFSEGKDFKTITKTWYDKEGRETVKVEEHYVKGAFFGYNLTSTTEVVTHYGPLGNVTDSTQISSDENGNKTRKTTKYSSAKDVVGTTAYEEWDKDAKKWAPSTAQGGGGGGLGGRPSQVVIEPKIIELSPSSKRELGISPTGPGGELKGAVQPEPPAKKGAATGELKGAVVPEQVKVKGTAKGRELMILITPIVHDISLNQAYLEDDQKHVLAQSAEPKKKGLPIVIGFGFGFGGGRGACPEERGDGFGVGVPVGAFQEKGAESRFYLPADKPRVEDWKLVVSVLNVKTNEASFGRYALSETKGKVSASLVDAFQPGAAHRELPTSP